MKPIFLAPLLLGASLGANAAAEPAWLGKDDCRIAFLDDIPADGGLRWKGACVDGYASGKGSLSWQAEQGDHSIEATLVRGEVSGSAVRTTPRLTYTGTLKNGVPHGQGFFKFASGAMYEGEVANGVPHGKGERLETDRTYYVGQWANGKRNGYGEATFTLGGSYKGEWKDNRFHGQGSIVYAGSGRKYEGRFEDGRVAGLPQPEKEAGRYAIKVATTGSHIERDAVVASVPMDLPWEKLSEAQKNQVRAPYLALEAGDDPPYPTKGQRQLFDAVRLINNKLGLNTGKMGVRVLVGKDGKPQSVTTIGAPSPELVQAVSRLVMLIDYKPAMCQGAPCEMVYPLEFSFSIAR